MSKNIRVVQMEEQGYNIGVQGRHVMVTEPMKDYAIEKVGKIDRFSHRFIEVAVTMDIIKLVHRIQIIMKVDHIKVAVHAESDDMYKSVDAAIDKLQRKLVRYKDRIKDHQAKHLSVIDMNVNVIRPGMDELAIFNDEIESENKKQIVNSFTPHEVVRLDKMPLKTLTQEEALMKMDLSDDPFLVFRGEEDRKLKVIYRQEDGDYGVIEVE